MICKKNIYLEYFGYLVFGMSIFCLVYFGYRYIFSRQRTSPVLYELYQPNRDKIELEILLEQNKFWLFHGEAEEGKKRVLESVSLGLHDDDFEKNKKVPYYVHLARVKDKVVGFITFFGSEEKKIGRVHLLAVDGAYRRLGIAEQLVLFSVEHFKRHGYQKVFLYTRSENIRAKKLYKKLLFYEIEVKEEYENLFENNPGDILVRDLV
jgi:ribosomal protein S18 acetylase RimI-like enzyme